MLDKVAAKKLPVYIASKNYTPKEMLKTPRFYLIIITLLLACMGGLMMIGFAGPIARAKGMTPDFVMLCVMAIGIANAGGRLVWGYVSDKFGRINTIIVLLAGTAVLALFFNIAAGNSIFVIIALIGFLYGGLLSIFPSLTADTFGVKNAATNYGIMLLGFGAGAIISSQIAGVYREAANQAGDIGKMYPAFIIASICAAAGIIMMVGLKFLAKRAKKKKEAAQADGQEK